MGGEVGKEGPRALERMEREAGLNARTVLKRVQGKDHLLILTTHALFLFGLQSGVLVKPKLYALLLYALLHPLLYALSVRGTGRKGRVAVNRERRESEMP